MTKDIAMDEIDRWVIYYYRNDFKKKTMAEKLGIEVRIVENKIKRLRKYGLLKRWWEEEVNE